MLLNSTSAKGLEEVTSGFLGRCIAVVANVTSPLGVQPDWGLVSPALVPLPVLKNKVLSCRT